MGNAGFISSTVQHQVNESQVAIWIGSLLGSFLQGCRTSLGDIEREPNLENFLHKGGGGSSLPKPQW